MTLRLTKAGREELALALLLLKDFKTQGQFDIEKTRSIIELSEILGVRKEFGEMMAKLPPMEIKERT